VLVKYLSSVPAPPSLPKSTSVPHWDGRHFSLWVGPSRSAQGATGIVNLADARLGGAANAPLLPDISCTTLASGQSQAGGLDHLHSPGRCHGSIILLSMHGGHAYIHASLQEHTCVLSIGAAQA